MKANTYENITKEYLLEEYARKRRSICSIAKELGCSTKVIDKKLNAFSIEKNKDNNDNLKHEKVKLITKEKFSELFLEKGLTYKEMSEIFGCSERQLKRLNSEKFKLKRDKTQITEFNKKNLEKSGISVNSLLQNARESFKEKYKTDNPSNLLEVQEKRKKHFQEKYGVDNPFQSDEVKEKIKETLQEKYGEGIINPSQVESLKKKTALAISFSKLKENLNEKQLEILLNKKNFENFINGLQNEERNYAAIGKLIGADETTIASYIKKYDLENLMKHKYSISSYEVEIENFIKSLGITNIEKNTKKYLDGKEIDIYLPDLKIGIEFNGNYWHSELEKKNNYHQEKSLLAESKGIFLYHIFEYEWEEKKEKIKNHLSNLLVKNQNIIYARKCELKIILNKSEKKEFLERYHLQGNDNSLYDFGLYYKNELVMLMTFCLARFTKGHDWELSRMCIKSGYSIVGGASKLFKYFVNNYINEFEKIVTYNDIGKTRGLVYKTLGFKKINISKPSYVWYRSHLPVLSRYKTQIKNEIKEMHSKKYNRIFDCGNNVWSYEKNLE